MGAKEGEAHQEEGQASCAEVLPGRCLRQGDPHAPRMCARGLWCWYLHGSALRSSVLWQVPLDIHVQAGRGINCWLPHNLVGLPTTVCETQHVSSNRWHIHVIINIKCTHQK